MVASLFALALPTFGQLVAEPLFIMIDTAIVGHLGENALAGLALGSTIILTAVGLCIFLAYSTTSQVAKLFGSGRTEEGLQTGIDGLWLSLIIGIILGCMLFFAAEPLCWALGGRGQDFEQGVLYTRAVVLGVPGMLLVFAGNGLHRGFQKVGITLAAAIAGAALNTILDVLFVIVLGWGIGGSGFATFIAQWFMGIVLTIPIIRWAHRNHIGLRPRPTGIRNAGKEGLPLFIRTLALRSGLVATVMAAAAMGTGVLAGYQVVNATWNFMVNVLDSVAIAGQTLVGAQLGAGDRDEARRLTRLTLRSGASIGLISGIVFVILGMIAPQIFSPEAQVQHMSSIGMVICGIFLPMNGWMWATDGILIGAGDFRYLAWTCTLISSIYICGLVLLVLFASPSISALANGDDLRCALLWLAFNMILLGGRAITNGLRIKKDAWMQDR